VTAVLDTNHFREYVRPNPAGELLRRRLQASEPNLFTTIVTAQESFQGWFNVINRQPAGRGQVHGYEVYQQTLEALAGLGLLAFDLDAALVFEELKAQRIRIGTMDMKIAAICLAHDATLLSRNLVDFEKVPSLKVENWLD